MRLDGIDPANPQQALASDLCPADAEHDCLVAVASGTWRCQVCGGQGGELRTPPSLPANDDRDGSPLRFEDLSALLAGGLEPPAQLVDQLVVAGQVNWFSGHPGHGKTTLALWVAKQHVESGGHVIWIDWEAGDRETMLRLQSVGLAQDALEERFHYAYSPWIAASREGFARIQPWLDLWPGSLVVFDSASKGLSVAGLDENQPTDATLWTTNVVMPIRQAGGTAMVIDHVTKGATAQMPYARGAGSKLADTDVAWYVEAAKPFSRQRAGELRLTLKKDRNGVLPQGVSFSIGDGQGGLPITMLAARSGQLEATVAAMQNRIIAVLKDAGPEGANTTQVKQQVRGNRQKVGEILKEMAEDGLQPVRSATGRRKDEVRFYYDEAGEPSFVRRALGGKP